MHTTFHRGTPLRITLHNGEIVCGKFYEHHSGAITIRDGEQMRVVHKRDMRACSVMKGRILMIGAGQ